MTIVKGDFSNSGGRWRPTDDLITAGALASAIRCRSIVDVSDVAFLEILTKDGTGTINVAGRPSQNAAAWNPSPHVPPFVKDGVIMHLVRASLKGPDDWSALEKVHTITGKVARQGLVTYRVCKKTAWPAEANVFGPDRAVNFRSIVGLR